MEKVLWKRPVTLVQKFEANEYVAACGDSGVVYNFKCTAGGGIHGDVYTADGRNLTEGRSRYYHACSATHSAPTTDDFIEGTLVFNGGNDRAGRYIGIWPFGHYAEYDSVPVIIWTDGGRNVHCTTDLDMDHWETAKS